MLRYLLTRRGELRIETKNPFGEDFHGETTKIREGTERGDDSSKLKEKLEKGQKEKHREKLHMEEK